jgi:4-amino-4-deoxy-L-arabinose transferase-like glycosyltransferase
MRLLNTGVYNYGMSPITEKVVPNAFEMPGYTAFLAGVYAFLPHAGDAVANILNAQLPVIILQLLMMVATAVVIAFAGYRLAGLPLGWISGLLAVAYVPFGINATVMLSDPFAMFLTALAVLAAVELLRDRGDIGRRELIWACALGLFVGLSTLVRPVISAWLLIPIGVFAGAHRETRKRAWQTAGVAIGCLALLMLPWIARNAFELRAFVPLTTSASTPLLDSTGGAVYTPAEQAMVDRAQAEGKDPLQVVALSRLWSRWVASPWGFVQWKAGSLWDGVGTPANLPLDVIQDITYSGQPQQPFPAAPGFMPMNSVPFYSAVVSYTLWYHRALLLLAALGLAVGYRRGIVWVLASLPLYYAVVHTTTLFMVRYFYPAIPALILVAGFGIASAWRLAATRLRAKTA